jgi:hypothetical protein
MFLKDKPESVVKSLIVGFLSIILVLGGCAYCNKKAGLEDDWIGEELLEEVIKNKVGIDIDLTPETPEKI